ncbi:MAG: efflux RND transporter periplasmic adaptor subunit [Kiritimatiellia bacterium]
MKPFKPVCIWGALACAWALSAAEVSPTAELRLPVVRVEPGTDLMEKTYPGRVVPVAQVNVIPQVSGEILEVGFENGTFVKKGDLLYRLDSVQFEAAVKNAEAKVAECKAALGYAELSYARHKKLVGSHAVSLDAVDNALSTRDSARASLAAAEADLISARDDLRHCRIVAPIAGKVGTTLYTEGNYLTKGQGTLVTLIQAAPIRVRFSISNSEFLEMFDGRASAFQTNGVVSLMLADGRSYQEKGQIEYIENAADDQTDSIQVFAIFANKDRILRPGGTVGVTLRSKTGVRKLAVPPSAVLQDMQGSYVWVVKDDRSVERRYVVRDNTLGDTQFIAKGLKEGERVVADGVHKVVKTSRIRPVD